MTFIDKRLSPLTINKKSWVCSWYDENGKRRWKSLGPRSRYGKREAERRYSEFAAQWHADAATRTPTNVETGVTVARLVELFIEFAKEHYVTPSGRRSSHSANMDHASRELVALCGHRPASGIRASDLRACREEMLKRDLTRVTINERVNRIRHIFKWGVGRDFVPPSVLQVLQCVEPLRKGRSGVREGSGRKTLCREAVDAVLPHVPKPVAAMIELQWLTGMRPGEVMSMRGRELDTGGDVWVYVPAEHKTEHLGKQRRVFLGPQAQGVIRPFLLRKLDEPLFSPRDAVADMHRSRGGDGKQSAGCYKKHAARYRSDYYRQAIHRACKRAGTDPWCPYDLRHTAASRLRREHGEEAARVILGHSSIDTTRLYGEVDRRKAIDVAAQSG